MADIRLKHRGHQVVIGGSDNAPKVLVDGQEVPVQRIGPDAYSTYSFAYTTFPSLEALVKAVIDHSAAFHGRRDVK
jgi:hypothetical protein